MITHIYKLTGEIIEYLSLAYAAEITGFSKGNISNAILGRLKTYKGSIWSKK